MALAAVPRLRVPRRRAAQGGTQSGATRLGMLPRYPSACTLTMPPLLPCIVQLELALQSYRHPGIDLPHAQPHLRILAVSVCVCVCRSGNVSVGLLRWQPIRQLTQARRPFAWHTHARRMCTCGGGEHIRTHHGWPAPWVAEGDGHAECRDEIKPDRTRREPPGGTAAALCSVVLFCGLAARRQCSSPSSQARRKTTVSYQALPLP
jgi:hypothetical protein